MPSEHLAATQQLHDDQAQQQIKLCSSCHRPLSVDSPNTPFLLIDNNDSNEATIVCAPCRNSLMAHRMESPPVSVARGEYLFAQVERELRRRAAALPDLTNEANLQHPSSAESTAQISEHAQFSLDEDIDMDAPTPRPHQTQSHVQTAASSSASTSATSRKSLRVVVDTTPHHHHQALPTTHAAQHTIIPISRASSSQSQPPQVISSYPDPLDDITRLRVRSQGHHCLYPGATFQGTQKSGRNSYDVNVTIVVSLHLFSSQHSILACFFPNTYHSLQDVDFASSHLCGYLRIRGLTDDWPELTTYFDAEIIGSRYGFLTRNWGATEQEDMVHWARFPAFRHVRHEMKKPHLTIKDADRGAVFMRWKEKFLVPNHRVQDISGASFAGEYRSVWLVIYVGWAVPEYHFG